MLQTRKGEQSSSWGIGNPAESHFVAESAARSTYGDPGVSKVEFAAPGQKTRSNVSLTWQGRRDFQGVSSTASAYGDPGVTSAGKPSPAMDKLYQQRTSLLVGDPREGGDYVSTAKESFLPQEVEVPEYRMAKYTSGFKMSDNLERPCFETTASQHFKQHSKLPEYSRAIVDKTASTVFQGQNERHFEPTAADQFRPPPAGALASSTESHDRAYQMRRAHFSVVAGNEHVPTSTAKAMFAAPPPGAAAPPPDFSSNARSRIELGDKSQSGQYESTNRASFLNAGPASPRTVDRKKLSGTHFSIGESPQGRWDSTAKSSFDNPGRQTPPERIKPTYTSNIVTGDDRTHELVSTTKESFAPSGAAPDPVFAQGAALLRNNQRTHFDLGQPKVYTPDSTFRSMANVNYTDHGVQPPQVQKSQLSVASPFALDPTERNYATQSGLSFVKPPPEAVQRPGQLTRSNQSNIRLGTREHDLTTSYQANFEK